MKKNIIVVSLILVIGVIIGVSIYKINKNSNFDVLNSKNNTNFNEFLKSAIDEINDLNKVLTSENVSNNTTYENKNGFTCKNYLGNDKQEIINRLYELYENPFNEYGYFALIEINNDTPNKELYVCLPKNCVPKTFDYKTALIVSEEKNKKIVNFTGAEFVIKYIDNAWKFEMPAVSCPLNQDLLEITE